MTMVAMITIIIIMVAMVGTMMDDGQSNENSNGSEDDYKRRV